MAVPQRKDTPIDQVLKLVDQLSQDEMALLRQKLNMRIWGQKWDQLVESIDKRNQGKPPMSEEEIMAEVLAAREEMKADRANQSSP
jgi:hypothetical protein